ncbi:uncharacterized protein [Spinacia oleracea]|uniref:DUF8039 domain-containing protein n=1 Tax=Spinacia oleracea TaxID=3562 RepID=A0ABM3RP55_SPIOL|nr:uncharacterized protein LOC130471359 [Spinacia oleracea]
MAGAEGEEERYEFIGNLTRVNQFHIEPSQAKKDVFESNLRLRFKNFKAKLVSGWISKTREISKVEKGENEGENEGENDGEKEGEKAPPIKLPFDIWKHITPEEWEAFVAQKTTPDAVAKRQKCSNYAKKKKHTHRLGPETYEEKRKRWKEKGLYPNGGNTRANDWWCSMHSLDKNGKYVIVNPETKEACDKLVEYQQACAEGKVSSVLNKDPLYMTLGPDPSGHPRGFGGVRVGLKKAYGEEYRKPTNSNFSASSTASDIASMREELKKEITEAILQQMGLQSLELPRRSPLDSSSQPILDLQPPNEGQEPTGFQPPARVQPSTGVQPMLEVQSMLGVQPMLELKEETRCELLHPGQSNGDKLYVVADANAQPQSDRPLVHFKQVPSGYYAVSPYNVHEDYLDWILPVPNNFLHTLADASGSYVLWPFAWVKFSDEVFCVSNSTPFYFA